MTLHQERAAAVRRLVDESRAIEKAGVTAPIWRRSAACWPRWPAAPSSSRRRNSRLGADGGIYRLAEDPDHRFALYASAGGAGKKVPPHNHTTWAIIAGVHGAERNVVYDRLDNGAREDLVQLREAPAKEKTLRRGDVICLPARGLPSHRDARRLGQRAAPSFLWAEPRAPARPRVGRHGDGQCQALHGQGQDPDAAARREAGQGDAEVGRDLRLLRRARGRRVLDPGPSAVRHAAAAVAAGTARVRPAARSAHPHRADGQRR